jgi:uncharacterized protein YjbI with pentapeptide repeats
MSSELLKQAFAALDAGRAEEATALLKDYLWRDPSDGVAYAALGVALSQVGQSEAALEAMEQAHYLRPLDARVLYNYGLVLAAAGDAKAARVRFAAALKVDPNYDRASRCLAQLESRTSRTALPESFPNAEGPERTLALSLHEPAPEEAIADAVFVEELPPDPDLAPETLIREEVAVPANGKYGPEPYFGSAQAFLETEPPRRPAVEEPVPAPAPEARPAPRVAHTPMAATLARTASAPPKSPPPPPITKPPKPPSRLGTGLMLVGSTAALAAALAYVLWPSPSSSSAAAPGNRPAAGPTTPRIEPGRMRGGDFAGANLQKQKLVSEDLQDARLVRADLSATDLTDANLMGVDATDAFFRGTNLTRAKLLRANLERADLEGAYLRGADLSGAKLPSARLAGAYVHSATLSAADLSRADLQRAKLTDARLDSAKLMGADLRGANLQGADLSNAFMDGARLQGAQYDASTLWPIGFDPAEEKAVLVAGSGAAAGERR